MYIILYFRKIKINEIYNIIIYRLYNKKKNYVLNIFSYVSILRQLIFKLVYLSLKFILCIVYNKIT